MWWKCKNGHEWQAKISHRSNGVGCPFCSGLNVVSGKTDLATTHPELAKEWNYEKNKDLLPTHVSAGSGKSVWWKCKKGHEWQAVIYSRRDGNGCPYCANQKVLKNYNDLETINSRISKEWNYNRNGDLLPSQVVYNSHSKVWWKCKKGHEWQATVMDRNSGGHNCPICALEKQTSFPEKIIFYYIKKMFPLTIENYKEKWLQNREIDIFIPNLSVGIEYDGQRWHKNVSTDIEKNNQCNAQGVKLIRIREPKCPQLNSTSIDFYLKDTKINTLKGAILFIFNTLDFMDLPNDYVDIERDLSKIYSLLEFNDKEKSLENINPTLTEEWNYIRNGNLLPSAISYRSGKKVWWKCAHGHEWQATVASRFAGSGCPYCSGRVATAGVNDLGTTNPILASEWNYEKNFPKTPKDFLPNSSKKVWWKCKICGYEWESTISNRNKGTGCPHCYREKIKK